jgi:hypothetical protein
VLLADFAFQACAFNHSAISPFRINHLRTRDRAKSDFVPELCPNPVRVSTHFIPLWAITGLIRARRCMVADKVWGVEAPRVRSVVYVGPSKNETSKREIPLNGTARAITQMLNRADELGHTEPVHCIWCASQHHHYGPTKPAEK